jgi:ureidoglycolate lyase
MPPVDPSLTTAPDTPSRRIELPVETATCANLREFGMLLEQPAAAVDQSSFYKGFIRMSRPVNFHCDHPVEISLATLARRKGEVRYLERHFQHTQTFIPLGGKPFVMVLAPPSEEDAPDLKAARAFRFSGDQGFALHLRTWHEFPFALSNDTNIVVVLSSQTGYDLATKDPVTEEASGPDLDKKDIVRRNGVVLTFNLDAVPNPATR